MSKAHNHFTLETFLLIWTSGFVGKVVKFCFLIISLQTKNTFLLTLFNIAFLKHQSLGGGETGAGGYKGYHNFVVIVLMIVKFGTGMKLDVFYTVIAKSS